MRAPTIRECTLAGAGIVGAVCAAVSSVLLYRLAVSCSFDWWLAPSLPIALDVGGTVGALAWIGGQDQVRRWGRALALGALLGSLVGNGLQHAIEARMIAPGLPLILAVGAAIPVVLWAVVHLAALMSRPVATRGKVGATRAARTKSTTTVAAPVGLASVPNGDRRLRGLDRDHMARWLREQPVDRPTREHDAIMTRFGCGLTMAKQVRAAARAEGEAAS